MSIYIDFITQNIILFYINIKFFKYAIKLS